MPTQPPQLIVVSRAVFQLLGQSIDNRSPWSRGRRFKVTDTQVISIGRGCSIRVYNETHGPGTYAVAEGDWY